MIDFYISLDWTTRALILSVILGILILFKMSRDTGKFEIGTALVMSGLIYFWVWAFHFADYPTAKFFADAFVVVLILMYSGLAGIFALAVVCLCIGVLFPGLATIATLAACGLIGYQVLSWMGIVRA